jgi:hypothetical protein
VTDEAMTRQHAWTVASWRDGAWCAACGAERRPGGSADAEPCRPAEATPGWCADLQARHDALRAAARAVVDAVEHRPDPNRFGPVIKPRIDRTHPAMAALRAALAEPGQHGR